MRGWNMFPIVVILVIGLVGVSLFETIPALKDFWTNLQSDAAGQDMAKAADNWPLALAFLAGIAANELCRCAIRITSRVWFAFTTLGARTFQYAALLLVGAIAYIYS